MRSEIIAEVRARAAQARRLANNMRNRGAQFELRDIADALEAHADELEISDAPIGPPTTDGARLSYLDKGIRKTQLKRDQKASLLASIQAGLSKPSHGMTRDEAITMLSQDLADYDQILARFKRA